MTFAEYSVVYLLTLAVFAVIDAVWLGSIAKDLYKHFLKAKLAKTPHWPSAIVFYLLFITGLVYFAIAPAIEADDISIAAVDGALFGLFTYATYQLTNMATLKGWPQKLVGIDLAWGVTASFTTSILVYVIYVGLN